MKKPPASLPFVFLNAAISADGKIAFANHSYQPFGSSRDHQLLLHHRTRADAVLTGARTINAFPVTLSSGGPKYRRQRLRAGRSEHPLRVIASGTGSINPKAKLFQHHFSPIIILTTQQMPAARQQQLKNLGAIIEICGEKTINFKYALRSLKKKWKVSSLLCEGGGTLNQSLFQEGLVDEINLTVCPLLFGGSSAPTLADSKGFPTLAQAPQFQLKSIRLHQNEAFLTYLRQT